ncbi:hypothetical protein [Paenibacillus radicis (ex Gao et al. 2016)]|uniref:Thymidylate kinase n=1 Tax=Paenibacillus radicis (ex Gao et al. 2016) TaxID=1737354 RepID=A0A917H734_9BACL|nr:hypothetical protein [Paenibacillus radicis (ex Gao et al. 2016)]GGG69687.1 hypothetical protein GCM10010918_26110 [Paenibacillus radicis (ex Gao et al. 2016)]
MLNSRIIIVDGMPGSGKSTTAEFISEKLNAMNFDHTLFLETSPNNPLFINTPAIVSLSTDDEADEFTTKVTARYADFVERYKEQQTVIIIESLIYQGILSVALFKGMQENKVKALAKRIIEILKEGMSPEVVFYFQEDAEKNWRRICEVRGPEFAKICGLHTDEDFKRAAQGWSYTQDIFCELLNEWNIPSKIIRNSDYSWDEYYKGISNFLRLEK